MERSGWADDLYAGVDASLIQNGAIVAILPCIHAVLYFLLASSPVECYTRFFTPDLQNWRLTGGGRLFPGVLRAVQGVVQSHQSFTQVKCVYT